MCDPFSLAVVAGALVIGQGVSQFQADKETARSNAQAAEAQGVRRYDNAVEANRNFEVQISRSRRKMTELKKASASDSFAARQDYLKARGSALAAAGSAGVEGVSIADLVGSFASTFGLNESARNENLRNALLAAGDEEQDVYSKALARRESIAAPPGRVAKPSPFAAGLNIAGDLVGVGANYNASQPKTAPTPTITPTTDAGLYIQEDF